MITRIDKIVSNSFGLWITALFHAIEVENPSLTFIEHKEAFFWLLEKLLKERKVIFIAPGMDCYISSENPSPKYTIYDKEAHWNATPEEIISYFKMHWPATAHSEDDLDLVTYFYKMPGIIWIDGDGKLYAS